MRRSSRNSAWKPCARTGRPKKPSSPKNFSRTRRPFAPSAPRRAKAGRQPEFIHLLNEWGGVTIAYRRRLIDAPSYTLNHEEVAKAFEEGVRFAEYLAPEEVLVDAVGAAESLRFRGSKRRQIRLDETVVLPARTILVAAGTQPNTVLAREDEHNVTLDGRFFQAFDETGKSGKAGTHLEAEIRLRV